MAKFTDPPCASASHLPVAPGGERSTDARHLAHQQVEVIEAGAVVGDVDADRVFAVQKSGGSLQPPMIIGSAVLSGRALIIGVNPLPSNGPISVRILA